MAATRPWPRGRSRSRRPRCAAPRRRPRAAATLPGAPVAERARHHVGAGQRRRRCSPRAGPRSDQHPRPRPAHTVSPSAGRLTTPTAMPCSSSRARRLEYSGTPQVNALVPSIGSMIQRRPVVPASGPPPRRARRRRGRRRPAARAGTARRPCRPRSPACRRPCAPPRGRRPGTSAACARRPPAASATAVSRVAWSMGGRGHRVESRIPSRWQTPPVEPAAAPRRLTAHAPVRLRAARWSACSPRCGDDGAGAGRADRRPPRRPISATRRAPPSSRTTSTARSSAWAGWPTRCRRSAAAPTSSAGTGPRWTARSRLNGVTWGEFHVVGTYVDGTFTLTEVPDAPAGQPRPRRARLHLAVPRA